MLKYLLLVTLHVLPLIYGLENQHTIEILKLILHI